jgi:deoxyribonuclease V
MLACVDVDYRGDEGPAVASCVVYEDWDSSESHEERFAVIPRVAPYTPGQFYQRELPCILQVLDKVHTPLDTILVDGHVWLDDEGTPGLGAHLYGALEEQIPVIGIAKNPFPERANPWFHDILNADGTPYDSDETTLIRQLTGTE